MARSKVFFRRRGKAVFGMPTWILALELCQDSPPRCLERAKNPHIKRLNLVGAVWGRQMYAILYLLHSVLCI
jgi:hypothetical protein